MKKTSARTLKRPPAEPAPPPGRRSGQGASSVVPYLAEARSSKPAPLEPLLGDDAPPPRRRSLWPW
jgi:hypothetical protein